MTLTNALKVLVVVRLVTIHRVTISKSVQSDKTCNALGVFVHSIRSSMRRKRSALMVSRLASRAATTTGMYQVSEVSVTPTSVVGTQSEWTLDTQTAVVVAEIYGCLAVKTSAHHAPRSSHPNGTNSAVPTTAALTRY